MQRQEEQAKADAAARNEGMNLQLQGQERSAERRRQAAMAGKAQVTHSTPSETSQETANTVGAIIDRLNDITVVSKTKAKIVEEIDILRAELKEIYARLTRPGHNND